MPQFRYTNPITTGREISMRDHCVIRVGDSWYMTGTSQPIWSGRHPGVSLWQSPDLLQWSFAEQLIDASKLPEDCPFNGRFWAPEIHRANDRFYLTVNSGHRGPNDDGRRMVDHNIWLFGASAITGPFELLHGPLGSGFKNDASLFTDEDGRSYCYCSGGGLWQSQIDLRSGRLIGDFVCIRSPRDPLTPDWMIGGIEGPFVIRRDETYYMLFSAWTRGYEIGVLAARSPLGPWRLQPGSPIFGTRKRRYRERQMVEGGYGHLVFEDTPDPFVETGHCAVFEGPDDKDWICCHYFREGRVPAGETSMIEYADSWPQLGIEPMHVERGRLRIDGPTWTERVVQW